MVSLVSFKVKKKQKLFLCNFFFFVKVNSLKGSNSFTSLDNIYTDAFTHSLVFSKGSCFRCACTPLMCPCAYRFGCRFTGRHPSILQAPLPQTPDAGEELQHQGQVRSRQGMGHADGAEDDDGVFSSSLCLLRVLDEILQKLVHLVQEEDCVS